MPSTNPKRSEGTESAVTGSGVERPGSSSPDAENRDCAGCGKTITPKRKDAKTCGDRCYPENLPYAKKKKP